VSGSARVALNALPIFRKFDGASFDSALMDLKRLYDRATAAAMDRRGDQDEWMRELRANRLHAWLEKNLEKTMSHAPSAHLGRIGFSLDVLSVLYHLDAGKMQRKQRTTKAGKMSQKGRADKGRKTVTTNIDRLEEALENGVLVLTRGKRSILRQLLGEAKAELAAPRSRSAKQKHPELVYLSQVLALQKADRRARRESILDVAILTGIECDATTAGKYAAMAGRVGSPALKVKHAMDRSDWHLLDVIEQNR
jgi:hypothetical protein